MIRIYIIALVLIFCQVSSAELTSSEETQVDEIEASEPSSTGVYSKTTCTRIESQFQSYLVNIMNGAISATSKSYNCLMGGSSPDCEELNSSNVKKLKDYRESLRKLYQEIANNWVRERSKQDARFKDCLDLPVQFEGNIHIVKTKLPYNNCHTIINVWPRKVNQSISEYLDGKRTITSLSPEKIASLKAFHSSPLKRILSKNPLSKNPLFSTSLTDSELKQKLASAYNTIKIGIEKLKDRVSKLKDRQKYILFDFRNQFSVFTNTLPFEERSKATSCIENSNFFSDCTIINVLKKGSRCGSRIWRLGKELLPVVPLIDSIDGMGDVMAAEASGIMSSSEAIQKRVDLTIMGMFGLGGIAVGASIARSAVKAGSSISRRQLVSPYAKETARLQRMGVDYVSGVNTRAIQGAQPRLLEIRRGATRGRRHTSPRGLALKHKNIDARIKEAESMGVKVAVRPKELNNVNVGSYYSPEKRMIVINSDSSWMAFEHEFQHALFHKYLVGHNFDVPTHVISKISKSDRSLRKVRERLPDTITRNWSREEQNVIIRYMRDGTPNSSLDETLSMTRELGVLGWRRYLPSGLLTNPRSTQNIANGLDATALGGTAVVVGTGLAQGEESFFSNLPENIRSAIESAAGSSLL